MRLNELELEKARRADDNTRGIGDSSAGGDWAANGCRRLEVSG